jgi:predicted alpha/beta superfamily hydrolase
LRFHPTRSEEEKAGQTVTIDSQPENLANDAPADPSGDAPGGTLPPGQAPLHPRLHLHGDFESEFLGDDRGIIVYVPPDYEESRDRAYPVLYLHDGQNLFDGRTSFLPGRTWELREHADAAILAGEVEPLVIVGIYNGGDRRLAEYTPERDWQMGGGEADGYGLMLTRELMPWIAGLYRVRAERESTGMGGSSLGGLVTLYLGLRHAEHFGRLAVLSPSVWWNRKSILRYLDECAPQIREKPRMWLDVGEREGVRTLENAEQLNRTLLAQGWRPGENLHFERVEGGTHDESSWAKRVRPTLKFLFPAPPSDRPER